MTVLATHISWTDTTWNPTTGCTKVSAGCDYCYAEALTNRLMGGGFEQVRIHPGRLDAPKKFKPVRDGDRLRPRLVFVNSMSDLHHPDIPDGFRHEVYDAMEAKPDAVFQVLTKRTALMGSFIKDRYGNSGVPANIWLGTSVENSDPAVAGRIGLLRKIKDRAGEFTAFLSVEPLIGPVDAHDYTGLDWVLIGGESPQNGKHRPMQSDWLSSAIEKARAAKAAVHFKQYGHPDNNPYAQLIAMRERISIQRAFREAVARGWEKAPEEKGGATFDGKVIRERPVSYKSYRPSTIVVP